MAGDALRVAMALQFFAVFYFKVSSMMQIRDALCFYVSGSWPPSKHILS
jgi:hypothetical protein